MTAKDCIIGRRSVRSYSDKAVTTEQLKKLVDMAAYAPSWKNSQTVSYIAVMDEELKARIADECVGGFAGNQRVIKNAPVLIIQTTRDGDSGFEKDGAFSTSKGSHWQSFDAGIAAEAFCLAAYSMGLGTLIMGLYDEECVKKVLSITEGISVSALISLGYADSEPNAPKRKVVDELLKIR